MGGGRSAVHQQQEEGQLVLCESGPASNHKQTQGLGDEGPPQQACLEAQLYFQAADAQPHAASRATEQSPCPVATGN